MIGLLLAHGADINAGNSSGWTPLHVAAMSGEAETADLLIANGAAVNARDQDGRTPLFRALKSPAVGSEGPVNAIEAVKVLQQHG